VSRAGPWLALALGLAAGQAGAEDAPIPVPSGQEVRLIDVVHDAHGPEGLTVRFRFLAPAIARDGGTVPPDKALADMLALCDGYALPRIPATGPMPAQIVISLSDRPVAFGAADPDATQYFEAYSIGTGRCVWEEF
jgi:hypothetical protein